VWFSSLDTFDGALYAVIFKVVIVLLLESTTLLKNK